MTDYIDNQIKIFEKIEEQFDLSRKHLESVEMLLKEDFKEILEKFCINYNLTSNNPTSVNTSKYYHIKSRVKTTRSLKEKLRRKNLGLKISLENSLSLDNFDNKHDEIKAALYSFDDIIGLRIVTELKADCYKVHKLINDKYRYFKDREIILVEDELKNQPETMKNGLPIFRIKGTYKNIYGFELQIKSKIDEAWGEMDHSIFYKDYATSPIKNTVQVTMNNVGELLDKIEDLLLGLRDSEEHYNKRKDEFDFLKDLSENVFNEIKTKLGDNYELGKIASNLKYLKNKAKAKGKDTDLRNDGLNYDFLSFNVTTQLQSNYIKHRNANFELLIMESLYFYWKGKADNNFKLTQENYNEELDIYIEYLADNMSINAKSLNSELVCDITKSFVSKIFVKYTDQLNDRSIFFDAKQVTNLYIIDQYFSEAYSEYVVQRDNLNQLPGFKETLLSIYIKEYLLFKNIIEFENYERDFPELMETREIESIIFDINKMIESRIDNFKLKDNETQFKSVLFLKNLSENVLNKARQYGK